jgi:hypothetical protein
MRPIQCRTYPVSPHILEQDAGEELILILSDLSAPYSCPLIDVNEKAAMAGAASDIETAATDGENNICGPYFTDPETKSNKTLILNERFLRATYTVWLRLIKDPLIHDLVKMDSEDRDFFVPVFPRNF